MRLIKEGFWSGFAAGLALCFVVWIVAGAWPERTPLPGAHFPAAWAYDKPSDVESFKGLESVGLKVKLEDLKWKFGRWAESEGHPLTQSEIDARVAERTPDVATAIAPF